MSSPVQRYVLIDTTNTVTDECIWDGTTPYAPGMTLVQSDTARIGDTYDGTKFTPSH